MFHSMITHVFSNINFWKTSFTVFLLFESKNLLDLKSISRNYCHKIVDSSSFLHTDVLLYQVYTIVYMYKFSFIPPMFVINET